MGCYDYFGTPFQKTVPLVYDESVSMAQQVAAIMGKLCELSQNEVTTHDLAMLWDRFVADQTRQDGVLRGYTDEQVADLWAYLEEISDGWLIWDETKGGYSPNKDAIRNLFNDVTVHALTVDQLAQWPGDVDDLTDCGLTVKGLALMSGWLMGGNFEPFEIFTDGSRTVRVRDWSNVRNSSGYLQFTDGPSATCAEVRQAQVMGDGYVSVTQTGRRTLTCADLANARNVSGRMKVYG